MPKYAEVDPERMDASLAIIHFPVSVSLGFNLQFSPNAHFARLLLEVDLELLYANYRCCNTYNPNKLLYAGVFEYTSSESFFPMSLSDSFAAGAGIFALIFAIISFHAFSSRRPRIPYPPGPPGDPFLGNTRQIPSEYMYKAFAEWGTIYDGGYSQSAFCPGRSDVLSGDVIHLRIFGQSMVVLNSYKAVTDLFERRSAIYSDRPRMTMTAELCYTFVWLLRTCD